MIFGIHNFINSQPLLESLMKKRVGLEIRTDSPARLADQLSDGELDMAMIPAIEYLRQADRLRLLPNISIASRNKVGTVLLISKVPLSTIRSLALDNRSRTSVALLQVLYSKVFPSGIRLANQKPDRCGITLYSKGQVMRVTMTAIMMVTTMTVTMMVE